ncbi:uncharacterized protein FOMMEDRAFT_156054 [Fomitiporia mediterranea MF3/22]|uniref:uncharacterized protein n=1 Tax=Fomitiporia mediterranea (strain MF3/22) TaxID=694068 RepID=UPI0004409982|nr:uncharacterized protein FOMMEDRAFT_156054 [Fomitiporia mediterranea MF3/22]EJD02721.1 hypothetical protein FOMMEDRAFT_156054 [Fomitiporia mediterranea MF3/22]
MSSSKPPTVQLRYKIAGCSEHSGRYVADNIKFDRPHDQTSRWSSAKDNSVHGRSWILIELDNAACLESITFGKFHKAHPCNMKDFEVHVGLSRDHLTQVLQASLKNDSKPETFGIRCKNKDGLQLPTKFVKIMSLSAHGHNFNTSIWYVALFGIMDATYVQRVIDTFERNRETLAMRHILKHLRQRRHISIFRQLQTRSGVRLEHPLVSDLYEILVLRGDWVAAEAHLNELSSAGLFSEFIHTCTPRARWRRLRGTDANGDVPGKRGGHAMCMDVERGLIYLFGGYDGQRSLDDFWVYDVREERWRLLSHSVCEEKRGPTPRACHKMVFDQKSGCIYVLGRLGDSDFQESRSTAPPTAVQEPDGNNLAEPAQGTGQVRSAWSNRRSVGVGTGNAADAPSPHRPGSSRSIPAQDYLSDFYRCRTRGIDQGNWELLNYDTAIKGGPKLIYDHQLVLDTDAQVLYVQGGRVVDDDWKNPKYSGLYSYDLRTDKTNNSDGNFSPRFGHSMVFEPNMKKLHIFAGQKDDYLADMWEYDIQSKTLTELFSNVSTAGGPDACFAQRAVIDPSVKEIYVFAGMTRRHMQSYSKLPVFLYRYDKRPGTWMRVPTADASSRVCQASSGAQRQPRSPKRHRTSGESEREASKAVESEEDGEPIARRACQVVYDPNTQIFYLHGGTAQARFDPARGVFPETDERLDDFWSMKLERPSPEEIIRRAVFEIRRQQFRELCEDAAPVAALAFLQNEVSAVVNHADNEEAANFRSLLSYLFAQPPVPLSPLSPVPPATNLQQDEERSYDSPSSSNSDSGSGEWTSELRREADEDAVMTDVGSVPAPAALGPFPDTVSEVPSGEDDPYELALRGGKQLSGNRFEQRTEVFESLLRFVGKAGRAKQPEGSLSDVLGDEEW